MDTRNPFRSSRAAVIFSSFAIAAVCNFSLIEPALSARSESVIYSFSGPDGSAPSAVAEGANGKFYGTTQAGGANNLGTLFELTRAGVLTTLHSFAGLEGAAPNSLIVGPDGNFYGTTTSGGGSNEGTIFKLTPTGVMTTLHSFTGADGAAPNPLIFGSDGRMYGTTASGGANGDGAIFSMGKAGSFKLLYSFSGSDGSLPGGALLEASDGFFYGVASGGGNSGFGTAFKVSSAGVFTLLIPDGAVLGGEPIGALVQGSDGNFYGVTTASFGSIYRMSSAGASNILYVFPMQPGDGAGFQTGFIMDATGDLFGTNTFGGEFAFGGFFKFTEAGVLTHLRQLQPGSDGTLFGPLIPLANGNFLGAASVGGSNGEGVIEELLSEPIPPTLSFSISPTSVVLSVSSTAQASWIPTDSDTCVASGAWSGQQATAEFNAVTLTFTVPGTFVYKLTCEGGGGSVTKRVSVVVTN
jgi:uncharacterized repeat protein (TIGR03803 family)